MNYSDGHMKRTIEEEMGDGCGGERGVLCRVRSRRQTAAATGICQEREKCSVSSAFARLRSWLPSLGVGEGLVPTPFEGAPVMSIGW